MFLDRRMNKWSQCNYHNESIKSTCDKIHTFWKRILNDRHTKTYIKHIQYDNICDKLKNWENTIHKIYVHG